MERPCWDYVYPCRPAPRASRDASVIIGDEAQRPYELVAVVQGLPGGKINAEHLSLENVGAFGRTPSRLFDLHNAADIAALHEINGVDLICDAAIDSYYSGGLLPTAVRMLRPAG